jgi:CO dehydrogenase maturation factor
LLGHVASGASTVVADLEAGIGTLTRLDESAVDVVLVVVEATPKSLEVGQRAVDVARAKRVGRVIVVANRVRSDEDRDAVEAAFAGCEVVEVPDDPAIVQADRDGVAPLDHDPRSPAVEALHGLADRLVTG